LNAQFDALFDALSPQPEHLPMSLYTADIHWERHDSRFTDSRYSRAHRWSFDGGASVPASSSPQVVRAPFSDPAAVDPEEAYVAALSSCHMLFFLHLAARAGYVVDSYDDAAEGRMETNAEGKEVVAHVLLRPQVAFSGDKAPDDAALAGLHHEAHESCFLANSVRTQIDVQGGWRYTPAA
jgi:organic hydroperoxide reductase OsmC/OhrA